MEVVPSNQSIADSRSRTSAEKTVATDFTSLSCSSKRIDVCFVCVSKKAPVFPLRQELLTSGYEAVRGKRGNGRKTVLNDCIKKLETARTSLQKIKEESGNAVSYRAYNRTNTSMKAEVRSSRKLQLRLLRDERLKLRMKRCEDKLDEISVVSGKSNANPASDDCLSLCETDVSDAASANTNTFSSDSSSHSKLDSDSTKSRRPSHSGLITSAFISSSPLKPDHDTKVKDVPKPQHPYQSSCASEENNADGKAAIGGQDLIRQPVSSVSRIRSSLSGFLTSSALRSSTSTTSLKPSDDTIPQRLSESDVANTNSANDLAPTIKSTSKEVESVPSLMSPSGRNVSGTIILEDPFESDTEDDESIDSVDNTSRIQDPASGITTIMPQQSTLTSSSAPHLISATSSTAQHLSESWSEIAPINAKATSATSTTAPATDSSSGVVTQSFSTTTHTTAPQISESLSGFVPQLAATTSSSAPQISESISGVTQSILSKGTSSDQMVSTSSSTDPQKSNEPVFSSPQRSAKTATTDPTSEDLSEDDSFMEKKPIKGMSSRSKRSSSKYDESDDSDEDSLASYLLMSDNRFSDDSFIDGSSLLLGDFDPNLESTSGESDDKGSWKGYSAIANPVKTEYAQLVITEPGSRDDVEAERAKMAMFSLEDQSTWCTNSDLRTGDAILPGLEKDDSSGLSEDTSTASKSIGKWYRHKNDSMVDSFNFSFVSSLETVETNMTSHADQTNLSGSGDVIERTNTYKSSSQSTIKTASWDDVMHPQVRITFSDIEDLTDDSKEFDDIEGHLDLHELQDGENFSTLLMASPSLKEFRTGQSEVFRSEDFERLGKLTYEENRTHGAKNNSATAECGRLFCWVFGGSKSVSGAAKGGEDVASYMRIQEDALPFLENDSKSSSNPTYYEFKSNLQTTSTATEMVDQLLVESRSGSGSGSGSGSKLSKDEVKSSIFGYSTPPEARSLASTSISKKSIHLPTHIAITSPDSLYADMRGDVSSVDNTVSKPLHQNASRKSESSTDQSSYGPIHDVSSNMNGFQQCIYFCCGITFEVKDDDEDTVNAPLLSEQKDVRYKSTWMHEEISHDDKSSAYHSSNKNSSSFGGYATPSEFDEESQPSFFTKSHQQSQSRIQKTPEVMMTPTQDITELIDMELLFNKSKEAETPRGVYTSDSSMYDYDDDDTSTGVKSISDLLLSDLH